MPGTTGKWSAAFERTGYPGAVRLEERIDAPRDMAALCGHTLPVIGTGGQAGMLSVKSASLISLQAGYLVLVTRIRYSLPGGVAAGTVRL